MVRRFRTPVVVEGRMVGEWSWGGVCDSCLLEIDPSHTTSRCPHCGAVFHSFCYTALLSSKGRCPKCKMELA